MSFGCSSNGSVRNDLALTNAVVSDTLSVNKLKANGAAITGLWSERSYPKWLNGCAIN